MAEMIAHPLFKGAFYNKAASIAAAPDERNNYSTAHGFQNRRSIACSTAISTARESLPSGSSSLPKIGGLKNNDKDRDVAGIHLNTRPG